MSHHSQHHFITQYISLRAPVAVNEFYRMIRIVVPAMLEVNEQRPMNNEYVTSRISKLSLVTLAGIFQLYSKFLPALQTRNIFKLYSLTP